MAHEVILYLQASAHHVDTGSWPSCSASDPMVWESSGGQPTFTGPGTYVGDQQEAAGS